MTLLGLIVAFGFGWWCCYQWGTQRMHYYQRQLQKAVGFCDGLKDANEVLMKKVERMEALGIKEDPNSLAAQIDRGILNGIEYMQNRKD